jgi:hypothetical protein
MERFTSYQILIPSNLVRYNSCQTKTAHRPVLIRGSDCPTMDKNQNKATDYSKLPTKLFLKFFSKKKNRKFFIIFQKIQYLTRTTVLVWQELYRTGLLRFKIFQLL